MSTPTYSSPLQEFWASMSLGAGGPGVFNVFELVPPRGQKLIVTSIEGSGTAGTGLRIIVGTVTSITAGGADASIVVSNPSGILVFGRTGTRVDAGILGYLFQPAFRMPWADKHVIDSVGGQRLTLIHQTANEASNVSIKGVITAAEWDTAIRQTL